MTARKAKARKKPTLAKVKRKRNTKSNINIYIDRHLLDSKQVQHLEERAESQPQFARGVRRLGRYVEHLPDASGKRIIELYDRMPDKQRRAFDAELQRQAPPLNPAEAGRDVASAVSRSAEKNPVWKAVLAKFASLLGKGIWGLIKAFWPIVVGVAVQLGGIYAPYLLWEYGLMPPALTAYFGLNFAERAVSLGSKVASIFGSVATIGSVAVSGVGSLWGIAASVLSSFLGNAITTKAPAASELYTVNDVYTVFNLINGKKVVP